MKSIWIIFGVVLISMISIGQTTTFNYTGTVQTYTVPTGVYGISVDMQGATGGLEYYSGGGGDFTSYGGGGGRIQANVIVTPGQIIYIYVGKAGTNDSTGYIGSGGGGASDIRIGGTALSDRKMVAGGGGGAGENCGYGADNGGPGGGLTGGTGFVCSGYDATACGLGGTQSSGGVAASTGNNGTLGFGGASPGGPAGGGGDGYYGGGSGVAPTSWGGGGGGGGSSYAASVASDVVFTQGYNFSGDGVVIITTLGAGISGITTLCPGDSTTLLYSGTGGTWISSDTVVATINPVSGLMTAISAGTDSIIYSLGGVSSSIIITVNPIPNAGTITGSHFVCGGYSITLSDSVSGGTWTSAYGRVTVSGGVVNGLYHGSDTVYYTCGNSCGTAVAPYAITISGDGISIITTIAGNGTLGFYGDGSTASSAELNSPQSVAVDNSGNIYITDAGNNRIRKIDTSGIINTIAGNGTAGWSGDGGAATAASLFTPNSIAIDHLGNIYFTDGGNNVIRKINNSGIISTIGGDNYSGFSGDGGPATAAEIANPVGIKVDNIGNIYFCDLNNNRIRKIDTSGIISTIAGTGTAGYNGDDTAAVGAELNTPTGLGIDGAGDIYIADGGNNRVRMVNTSGIISTVAGNGISGYGGEGLVATATELYTPCAVEVDTIGNIYITMGGAGCRIRKVNTLGVITTIAGNGTPGWSGDGGAATVAEINWAWGLAVDQSENVYIADNYNSRVRKVTPQIYLPIISGDSSVCVGSTLTFTTTVTGGTWSAYNSHASISVGGIVTGISFGTDTIAYTVTGSCGSQMVTKVITINPLPNAGIISGPNTICMGSTATLSDSLSGGVWSSSDVAHATVSGSGVVTSVAAGSSSISYTVTNVCGSSSATVLVTINPLPNAGHLPAWTTICVGAMATLTDTLAGGMWSASNGNATVAGGIVTGVSSGTDTISYSVTNSCGTAITDTPVYINPLPDAGTIAGVSSVCPGSTDSLFDSMVGGSYSWSASNGNAWVVSGTGFGIVTGVSAGADTITYSLSNSCGTSVATKTITVYTNPDAGSISGSGNVCAGSGITLTDAVSGGAWTNSNTNASVSGGFVTGISPGITIVSYTVANYCGTAVVTKGVTINPTPDADSITGADSVCAGAAITLSDTISGGAWSCSNTNATAGYTGIINGITAGVSIISYSITNSSGCTNFTSKAITIKPLPNAGVITGLDSVCAGYEIILSDSISGGVWTSSDTAFLYVNAINGVVTNSVGPGLDTGTYLVSYSLTNSCGTAVATKPITLKNLPNTGIITGTTSVCAGSAITLIDTVGGGTWSSTNSNVTIAVDSPIALVVTGVTAGISIINYSFTNSCGTNVAFDTITVKPLPYAGFINGGANVVCPGTSITLTDSISGGVWSCDSVSATVSNMGVVTGLSINPYSTFENEIISYTVTNSCGSAIAVDTISVYPAPYIAGAQWSMDSICAGSSKPVSYTTNSPTSPWWGASNGTASLSVNGYGTTSNDITGSSAGLDTISFNVQNSCGMAWAYTIVNVFALPNAGAITGLTSVCIGDSITLSDTVTGGVWSQTNSNCTINASGSVIGHFAGTDTINYSVVSPYGCSPGTAILTITINPLPVSGVITGVNMFCSGSVITVADTVAGGSWHASNGNATVADSLVTGINAGIDTISYAVTNVCGTATSTLPVTIYSIPVAGSITGLDVVCAGHTITFTDSTAGGTWSCSNANASVMDGVVTGIAAGTSIVSYSVSNICGTATATANMTVFPSLPDAGHITGDSTVCLGSSVTLNDTVSGGVWSATNTNVSVLGSVVTGAGAGIDTLFYSVTNGCGTDSAVYSVIVEPMADPGSILGISNIMVDSSTDLYDSIPGGLWSISDNTIAGIDSAGIATGVSMGSAILSYTVSNSCGNATTTQTLNVVSAGIISTVAGDGIGGFGGDEAPAILAQLDHPTSVVTDQYGFMYIADSKNNCIRMVDTFGYIYTIAGTGSGKENRLTSFNGDGGQATNALLNNPQFLAIDKSGNIYFSDAGNQRVRVIKPTGGNVVERLSWDSTARVVKPTGGGIIETVAGTGIAGYSGDGGAATDAQLNNPSGIAVDDSGNVFIADAGNARVRVVKPTGGNVIETIIGTGAAGYSGDGAAASAAQLNNPQGVAIDNQGNLYIADAGNSVLRVVKPTGGNLFRRGPDNRPIDSSGKNSRFNSVQRVVKPTGGGIIETIAGTGIAGYSGNGGPGTAAQLNTPMDLIVDNSGTIVFTDAGNSCVRQINPNGNGIIKTIAGNNIAGFNGDGDLAVKTELNYPVGVAFDNSGNIKIADRNNNRIRSINFKSTIKPATPPASGFRLFPNPAPDGSFTFILYDFAAQDVQVEIADAAGKKIGQINTATNTYYSLNLNVQSGIYFVTARTKGANYSEKLIIIR